MSDQAKRTKKAKELLEGKPFKVVYKLFYENEKFEIAREEIYADYIPERGDKFMPKEPVHDISSWYCIGRSFDEEENILNVCFADSDHRGDILI